MHQHHLLSAALTLKPPNILLEAASGLNCSVVGWLTESVSTSR